MTYCVAIKLNAGLVFLSDSRTNAGLDQISTFRKMIVYEKPGDRFMVLLSAGNLSVSQSVREILQIEQIKEHEDSDPITIWNAKSMFDAARVLGAAIRHVYERDAASLKLAGVEFNVSLIFGGQIKGEGMRLFQVYSAGNFIEATLDMLSYIDDVNRIKLEGKLLEKKQEGVEKEIIEFIAANDGIKEGDKVVATFAADKNGTRRLSIKKRI